MDKQKIINKLSRRTFIRNTVIAATGVTLLPSALTSCKSDDDYSPILDHGFFEGVASFDPSQERVILWTRYTPAPDETLKPEILLDVATDRNFNQVLVSQPVEVDTASDNTVNVDVSNLSSNTKYYYRFRNERNGTISVVGETKTLPAAGEATEVKLAVVSCANYQSGLFNAYGAVAESDADVVVHLGDYIYEHGRGSYGTTELTIALGRLHEPKDEIITIAEYRARYRQYRRDEQLQKAHQLKPFICVWDDHEIANNAFENGAENHQPEEGDFATRKLNAIQAWHEYLPARVNDNARIYRSFDIAGIVNLMMLDTRIIGRDRQLNYNDYVTPGGLDSAAFLTDLLNPNRTILGAEQRSWLMSKLRTDAASWQVLGSQVLMGRMLLPAELFLTVSQIVSGDTRPETLAQFTTLVTQLVSIKIRVLQGDPTVSDAERARVETVLPYNLDAWDGYPVEREMIYAVAAGKKIISLAGDTHNAWYSDLTSASGSKIGAEFATASVSSPGMEGFFGTSPEVIDGLELALNTLIDNLNYLNASDRGYVMATFTDSEAKADWRFIRTLATKNTSTTTGHTATEG